MFDFIKCATGFGGHFGTPSRVSLSNSRSMDLSALAAARKRERPRTLLGRAVPSQPTKQAGAQVARVGGSEAIMFGSAETPQCAAQSPEFAERCDAVALFC